MRFIPSLFLTLLILPGLSAEDIEIVVTASRVEEEARDVPASVSVITAGDLAASGQTTVVDALAELAGIHFRSSSGNAAQAEIAMRGFGENSNGRVLVLVDGRRLNRPDMAGINWLQVPLENIERIEVVRGGSSVLYGDHAVAGVVNIITRRGGDELSVTASTQLGSFGLNQQRAGVSGPAGPLTFSASAEHTATDGYRDRSGYGSVGAALNLGAPLGEAWDLSLALAYDQLDFQMPGALTAAEASADPTRAGNPADEARQRYFSGDLGLSADWTDSLGFRANLAYGLKAMETDVPSNFTPTFTDLWLHSASFTPRLELRSGPGGVENDLVAGFDGMYDRLSLTGYTDAARGTVSLEALLTRLSGGFYARDEVALGDALRLSGGVRYDLERVTAEGITGSTLDNVKNHSALVYDIGLAWLFGEDSKAYLRYNRVFRYPFLDEQAWYQGFGDAFFQDLEAEEGHNVEAGLEAELLPGVRVGLNGFFLAMDGEIASDPVTWENTNLDETRRIGGEATLAVEPFDWLTMSGSYTYTRAVFRAGPNEGNRIPLVPEHLADGRVELRLPLGLALNGEVRYQGESIQGGDVANTAEEIAPFWVADLALRFRPAFVKGDLELYAGVENLFDRLYTPYVFWDGYYPAPGRAWKVGGSYRY